MGCTLWPVSIPGNAAPSTRPSSGTPPSHGPPVEPLAAHLRARFGLTFSPHRRKELEAKLARQLRLTGLSHDEYLVELARSPDDAPRVQELLAELTINETRCFRDPRQLAAVEEVALPALADAHPGPIRAWSAGCATGEEAWTLALLLERAPALWRRPLEVVGTDLVRARVEAARKGEFGPRSLEGLPADVRAGWFAPSTLDRERLDADRLRCRVSFAAHNLVRDPPPPGPFSLVMCRNVLIYYDDPADQLALVRTLIEPLAEGGWLVLGHAERPPEGLAGLEPVSRGGAVLYRKRGGAPLRTWPVLLQEEPPPAPRVIALAPFAPPERPLPPPPPVTDPAPAPAPDPAARLADAMARADAGELDLATGLLLDLIAARPTAAMARVLLASLAERRGELGRARAWLEEATYLAPADAEVRRHAAAVFDRLGLPVEAEAERRAAAAAERST